MTTIITKHTKINDSHLLEITSGKQSASLWIAPDHVMVCSLNASHRAWKGLGRRFNSLASASDGYKSSAMKSIISAAAFAIEA